MPAYKEKDGTWSVSFHYQDWTGAKRRKHKRGFKTKKQAQIFESEFKLASKADLSMKMKDFIEIYFNDKENELKARTKKNKAYMINAYITRFFGSKAVNEITPADIIAWQNEIKEKNSFSESYLRMIQNQLTALFTHAEKIYGLKSNPCKKVKKMGNSDGRSLNFWTRQEYDKFISTFEKGYHVMICKYNRSTFIPMQYNQWF
ncbi:Phage integrase, N-terminal SAM-like domain [Lachnospiraceae bacterium]|nr:Phage integrase, N-terminal SAM-like domain [Lachnospiraceae bacterium]